jgi:hypothetical protein
LVIPSIDRRLISKAKHVFKHKFGFLWSFPVFNQGMMGLSPSMPWQWLQIELVWRQTPVTIYPCIMPSLSHDPRNVWHCKFSAMCRVWREKPCNSVLIKSAKLLNPEKLVFDMSVLMVILSIISVIKSFSGSGTPSS